MALKRLPTELTFDAVRNQSSPFAKPTPEGPNKGRKGAEERMDEEGPASVSSEPTAKAPASDSGVEQGVKKRRKPSIAEISTDVASFETKQSGRSQSSPKDHGPKPAGDTARPDAARTSARGETVILKGRISAPADGVTPIYDTVKARYGDKPALKHLITVALEGYTAALLSGDASAQEKQPGFTSLPPSRASFPSRAVSREFYDVAKAHIDPLGIMSPSGLNTAIMRTALEWYIARNPTQD